MTVLSASNQPLTDAELKAIFDTHNRDASGGLNTKNLRLIIQEFLLLMRNFMDESDADQLRKEKECVQKSGFNSEEVQKALYDAPRTT